MKRTLRVSEIQKLLAEHGLELYEIDEYDGEDNYCGSRLGIREKPENTTFRIAEVYEDGRYKKPLKLYSIDSITKK